MENRIHRAETLATKHGFQHVNYQTASFTIYAQEKILSSEGEKAHIYIEGDGYGWAGQYRISPDPTPREPVALKLATQDPHPRVIYMARPCQFTRVLDGKRCHPGIWTAQRSSAPVVAAMSAALTQIKQRHDLKEIVLIGYSGGGTLAALLAARRSDVSACITVAGNLDIAAWIKHHDLSPLQGSLSPMDFAGVLRAVPQVHFVGTRDETVPPELAHGYFKALRPLPHHHIISVPDQGHHGGWDLRWKSLLQHPLVAGLL